MEDPRKNAQISTISATRRPLVAYSRIEISVSEQGTYFVEAYPSGSLGKQCFAANPSWTHTVEFVQGFAGITLNCTVDNYAFPLVIALTAPDDDPPADDPLVYLAVLLKIADYNPEDMTVQWIWDNPDDGMMEFKLCHLIKHAVYNSWDFTDAELDQRPDGKFTLYEADDAGYLLFDALPVVNDDAGPF